MKHTIRLLIVEDEKAYQSIIQIYAEGIEGLQVRFASNYKEALALLEEEIFDIAMLDIILDNEHKTGIDIARFIRTHDINIPIIFLTNQFTNAYYELAKSVNPHSFLSKQLSFLKFRQAIELALVHEEEQTLEQEADLKQILVKVGSSYKNIPFDNIFYFFTENGFSYVHTATRDYPINTPLMDLANMLNAHFIRIHQSYLVNTEKVTAIDVKNNLLSVENVQLPIGPTFKKRVLSIFTLLR